ncbi:MAG: coproporphyrinogen III oxidase family protein [Firmicutes bacterium]|nr:coproporphyrinogen III oxidase family protein [Bacillota bacterium]
MTEGLFKKGMELFQIANTAYPLSTTSLMEYRVKDQDKIRKLVTTDLRKSDKLSLYVHVPFCKSRCTFCEYTVTSGPEADMKEEYIQRLEKEIDMYAELAGDKEIVGFDIGGGTPTELSEEHLSRIMERINDGFDIGNIPAPSIETTPLNAARDIGKLMHIRKLGFPRISMGVQEINSELLKKLQRDGDNTMYRQAMENMRDAGFDSVNLDLMYGFKGQGVEDFLRTIDYAISLNPEHITLYEMRYKFTQIVGDAKFVTKEHLNELYEGAFEVLAQAGYAANFGKNTFSKIEGDYGTSSYLTERVINAVPYIGMGAGSQSFGTDYLAYNKGAATKSINGYMNDIDKGALPIQDIYNLPLDESIAKAVSVMFYFGSININAFKQRFGVDFLEKFGSELAFLMENNYIEIKDDQAILTVHGVRNMNGIIPLFHSERSQKEMMDMKSL